MPVIPFIPMIASTIGGAIASKKAQSSAAKRSPEEQTALTGAQGAGSALATQGANLMTTGQDTLAQPTSYYQQLLGGNRALQSQAIAAPRAAISDTYRGAERSLDQGGVRGAQRDVAQGELSRQRAGQISSLITGVQPAAAQALTGIGQTQTQQGIGATSGSGSLFSSLLGQGAQNRQYARSEGEKSGTAWGGMIFDMLSGALKSSGGGGKSTNFGGMVPNTGTGGFIGPYR